MQQPSQPGTKLVLFVPADLVSQQDKATRTWHDDAENMQMLQAAVSGTLAAEALALRLHAANFTLWHLEDDARDANASDRTIVECKRSIDRTNQLRNNLVEQLDEKLLSECQQNESAPLHSETPGQIVDRLSILSLKIHHTREESERVSATADHRERNAHRLAILSEQRNDLQNALAELLEQIGDGRRRFRLYRQLKMYNDPELNPVLYSSTTQL